MYRQVSPWHRNLVLRLSVLFFFLAFLLAGFQYLLFRYLWVKANDEIFQRLDWNLAHELARELQPLYKSKEDRDRLFERIARFEQLHPTKVVFVLDSNGVPREYVRAAAPGDDSSWRGYKYTGVVPLALIKEALTPQENRSFPIYGPAIDRYKYQAIFSIAPISRYGELGYVYIVLHNNFYRITIGGYETIYVSGAGLLTSLLLLLLVGFSGVFLTRNLSKRFRGFTSGVAAIAGGNFEVRVETSGNDEITDLGNQINSMADVIESSIETLKANDVWRREMTAAISHDLQGPIAAISAHLEQVQRLVPDSDTQLSERFAILNKATQTLRGYVRDILDLARLEAGDLEPNVIGFPLQELLSEEIFPMFESVATAKGLSLSLAVEQDSPLVFGDPDLLTRALSNLVSNAIQYTSAGGSVTLGCTQRDSGVYCFVKDTGPGLDSEQMSEFLKPFTRGDRARSATTPGAGLGLAIARSIALAHGSELEIISEPKRGSEFGFLVSFTKQANSALRAYGSSTVP